jgi:DNA-binding response OmpR family regulator
MKILAVDDDPIILELLSHFIEGMTDHTLVTAECAADALQVIKDNARAPFDSFLLDIQMPVTDGIELASQIRSMKQYIEAPILMLTAMSEKSYIDAAFSAGATDYVTKPFEMTELKARLSLVERAVEGLATRTSKIFAAKAVTHHNGKPERAVQLHEPMAIHDVNNLIEFMALENYVQQLSRSDLFGSICFAFNIRDVEHFHGSMSNFEFCSMLSDVGGTFVCITESGWRPDPRLLANDINISLAKTELFDNRGEHINPRICAGKAVRLMWKTNSSVMDALSEAHVSAEEATANYQKVQNDFWNVGRTA